MQYAAPARSGYSLMAPRSARARVQPVKRRLERCYGVDLQRKASLGHDVLCDGDLIDHAPPHADRRESGLVVSLRVV